MSVGVINGNSDKLYDYQDFSIQCFNSIQEFIEFAEIIKSKGSAELNEFLDREREMIDNRLQSSRKNIYGLKGTDKAPLTYQDALNRKEFVYKDEYHNAKEKAKHIINKELEKSSLAEAMKSKMIFTERELGEFVYERASMSIKPNLFYYSRVHNTEVNDKDVDFKIINNIEKYTYKKDSTPIELCIKITIAPNSEYNKSDKEIYE